MAGQPLYIEDILAALRERRIGAETAVNWLEMRAAEQRRQVRAHSNAAVWDLVVKAVGSARAGDGGDEFSQLFPPHDPFGPELGHVE